MTADVSRFQVDGFDVVQLSGGAIRVAVVPALGAKVIGLSREGGREWMWKPSPDARLFSVEGGTPFDRGPFLGADECLPTIAPCRWCGRNLPDHGEAWSQAWQLDEEQLAAGRIGTRLRLPISPLEIERIVGIVGDRVTFDYSLRNCSDKPEEYVWAFHPMMNVRDGDRIVLPESCRRVRVEGAIGFPSGGRGDEWEWPCPATGVDLSRLNLGGPKRAAKLFTEPLQEGRAAIVNDGKGERIIFTFNVAELNTLGIWINRGGFGGFHHVALEPSNGAPDSLAVAVEDWRRFGRLAAGETRRWSFTVELSAG